MSILSIAFAVLVSLVPPAGEATDSPAITPAWKLATADAPERVTQIVDTLLQDADAASAEGALREFDQRLLAANWILARQLEPMASRLLLEAPQASDPVDAARYRDVAGTQLDRAGVLLDELVATGAIEGENRRRRLESLQGLRAFSAAFAAIWPTDASNPEEQMQRVRSAASDLAIVREDYRGEVAAAATLWQAYLYGRGDQLDRAMDSLPMALSTPHDRAAAGFYTRLLRCRYVLRTQESHAVAAALLARVEERCLNWFDDPDQKQQAQRVAGWVRRQILLDWAAKFRQSGQKERAAWCDGAIARLDEDYFDEDSPAELLRLPFAAPPFVPLTEVVQSPAPGETPSDESGEMVDVEDVEDVPTSGVEDEAPPEEPLPNPSAP